MSLHHSLDAQKSDESSHRSWGSDAQSHSASAYTQPSSRNPRGRRHVPIRPALAARGVEIAHSRALCCLMASGRSLPAEGNCEDPR